MPPKLPKPSGYNTVEGYKHTSDRKPRKRSKLLPDPYEQPSQVLDEPETLPDVLSVGKISYSVTHPHGSKVIGCTPDVTQRAALLVASGITQQVATAAMGISWGTVVSWNRNGREDIANGIDSPQARWWAAMLEARAACQANWVARVNEGAKMDWKAAAWLLERRFPQQWYLRREDNSAGESSDVAGKTEAELKEMLAALQGRALTDGDDSPAVLDVESTSKDVDEE